MLRARQIYIFSLIFCFTLYLIFNWTNLITRGYVNASAYHLARAVLTDKHTSQHLQQSWALSLRALQYQPEYVAAQRLALRTLVEDKSLAGAEPSGLLNMVTGTDNLSLLYAGRIMWESGDQQRATETWRLGNDIALYYMQLGNLSYDQGNMPLALGYYEISCAVDDTLDDRKLQMYRNRCSCAIRQTEPQDAILWCTRAAQIRKTVWILLALGRVFYVSSNYEAALSTLEQARVLNPNVASVHYWLGRVHERLAQDQLALESYEQGIQITPNDPSLNLAVGDLYARIGNSQMAYCAYWRAAQYGSDQSLRDTANSKLAQLPIQTPSRNCSEEE